MISLYDFISVIGQNEGTVNCKPFLVPEYLTPGPKIPINIKCKTSEPSTNASSQYRGQWDGFTREITEWLCRETQNIATRFNKEKQVQRKKTHRNWTILLRLEKGVWRWKKNLSSPSSNMKTGKRSIGMENILSKSRLSSWDERMTWKLAP